LQKDVPKKRGLAFGQKFSTICAYVCVKGRSYRSIRVISRLYQQGFNGPGIVVNGEKDMLF
jgi:hypothetical protein